MFTYDIREVYGICFCFCVFVFLMEMIDFLQTCSHFVSFCMYYTEFKWHLLVPYRFNRRGTSGFPAVRLSVLLPTLSSVQHNSVVARCRSVSVETLVQILERAFFCFPFIFLCILLLTGFHFLVNFVHTRLS
jgi:hypothetical protein